MKKLADGSSGKAVALLISAAALVAAALLITAVALVAVALFIGSYMFSYRGLNIQVTKYSGD